MEVIPAPFRHTPEELRRAVREHTMSTWRDWFDQAYQRPQVIRLFGGALSSPTFLMPGMAFGAGHLGAMRWIEEGWGIHIRNEETCEMAEELRAQLAKSARPRPCYGYVWMREIDVMVAMPSEPCPYLTPVAKALLRGEPDAFLPVEIVRVTIEDTERTRLRPFLPALPQGAP